MPTLYELDAPRRAVNLSLNSDLLKRGKELGINISAVAEEALAQAVKARLAQAWVEENADAIQAYNRRVEKKGVASDGLRTF